MVCNILRAYVWTYVKRRTLPVVCFPGRYKVKRRGDFISTLHAMKSCEFISQKSSQNLTNHPDQTRFIVPVLLKKSLSLHVLRQVLFPFLLFSFPVTSAIYYRHPTRDAYAYCWPRKKYRCPEETFLDKHSLIQFVQFCVACLEIKCRMAAQKFLATCQPIHR